MTQSSNSNNNTKNVFNHQFEGYSVWLEPCQDEALQIIQEMNVLSTTCGGQKRGTHPFALHCTLLYNFNPIMLDNSKYNDCSDYGSDVLDKISDDYEQDNRSSLYKDIGSKLLHQCVDQYNQTLQQNNKVIPTTHLELNPTDFYFFSYPKEADNNRGFGCVISMLLLEKNHNLEHLHNIVSKVFPLDERHGRKDETHESKNEAFRPHMALVYAPEIYHDSLKQYTEETLKISKSHLLKPIKAKYLSLWSTKGTLKDWKLIARVGLH